MLDKRCGRFLVLTFVLSCGKVQAGDAGEHLVPSVVGGFIALVVVVIIYHCYLKRQQLKTPYNYELSGAPMVAKKQGEIER